MLKPYLLEDRIEAGCDEAGRGCLAGPVFGAAVILPVDFQHPELRDSKKLSSRTRANLVEVIEGNALAYAVARVEPGEIDEINILRASIKAMHLALDQITIPFDHILVDGNKFIPYKKIFHSCVIKGDDLFLPIAAASVLAKYYRDKYMQELDEMFPEYQWRKNKGYPTIEHRNAIFKVGHSKHHRLSFRVTPVK